MLKLSAQFVTVFALNEKAADQEVKRMLKSLVRVTVLFLPPTSPVEEHAVNA